MPEADIASDGQLMERLRGRDESAMATLYDRYARLVYTVGMRVLQDAAAAEDLTHDVFLGLWRAPAQEMRGTSLAPWLAVVARNRAVDLIRRRKFVTYADDETFLPEPSIMPQAENAHLAERAKEAISHLSAEQRQALELAYFEGLSHTEIAEKTGVPLGTIKTRIRAGLQSLRKEFC